MMGIAAGQLRELTRRRGLSLGDRACLALAIRENAIAVTADRDWGDLDIGCKIELIR
jgi:PIN domain nuclease of toxin-antitoxin system